MHEYHDNTADERQKKTHKIVHKVVHMIVWIIVGIAFAAVFALLFAFIVQWLWNLVMPDVFGLKEIGYWQAFGLLILTKILFGGAGWHRDKRHHLKAKFQSGDDPCGEFRMRWEQRSSGVPPTPANQ
jgi:hypothetical protein